MKAYFADPKRQIAALKPLLGSRSDLQIVRTTCLKPSQTACISPSPTWKLACRSSIPPR